MWPWRSRVRLPSLTPKFCLSKIFEQSNIRYLSIRKYEARLRSNARLFECSTVRMLDCSNARLFECSTVRMLDCSNARLFECSTVRMLDCSNARLFECSVFYLELYMVREAFYETNIYFYNNFINGKYYIFTKSRSE